ncbi:fungal-specific transcription factor domain-containing protein [Hyaloraphidium curvatum]|nr:fungal-specific transcription factor domain-containing protein [Hyaloraphidium curvatum]
MQWNPSDGTRPVPLMVAQGLAAATEDEGQGKKEKVKGKRIGQACDNCHRNKKKCSGERPICSNCARSNRECSYSRSHKKKETRSAYVVELEKRLLQIEGMLSGDSVVTDAAYRDIQSLGKPGRKKTALSGPHARSASNATTDLSPRSGLFPMARTASYAGSGVDTDGYGSEGEEDGAGSGDDDSSDSGEELNRITELRRRIEQVGQLAGLRVQQQLQQEAAAGTAMAAAIQALPPARPILDLAGEAEREAREREERERRKQEIREIKKLADDLLVDLAEEEELEDLGADDQAQSGNSSPNRSPTRGPVAQGKTEENLDSKQLEDLLRQLYSGNLPIETVSTSSSATKQRDRRQKNAVPTAKTTTSNAYGASDADALFGYEFQPAFFGQPGPDLGGVGKRRRTEGTAPGAIATTLAMAEPVPPSLPSAHLTFEQDFTDSLLFSGAGVEADLETPKPADPLSNALLARDQTTSMNSSLRSIRREGRGFGTDEVGLAAAEMGLLSNPDGSSIFGSPQSSENSAEQLLNAMSQLSVSQHNPSPGQLQVMARLVPPVQFRPDLFFTFFTRAGGWSPCVFLPDALRELHSGTISPILGWAACAGALVFTDNGADHKTGYNPESEVYFARAKRLIPACVDGPCLTSVQALLLMALYATGSGRPSAAWMYSGMATRMAYELRLHLKPDAAALRSLPMVEREARCRTWWACFLLDACSSAVADRPPFLNVDDVTADLPDDDLWNSLDDWGNPIPGTKSALVSDQLRNDGIPTGGKVVDIFGNVMGDGTNLIHRQFQSYGFREFTSLMLLFSKVIRYVRKSKPERTQILKTVDPELAKLDSQLLDWYARLPESLGLSNQPLVELVTNDVEQRKFVATSFIHLLFQTTCILLHRPELTLHNFAWPSGSSFDACTRAANAINTILERLLAVDPKMEFINAFAAFCVFESGVIHLVNSIVGDLLTPEQLEAYTLPTTSTGIGLAAGAPSRNAKSTAAVDPRRQQQAFIEAAKRSLRTHLNALKSLKRYWASAECYYVTLGRLVVENNILPAVEVYEQAPNLLPTDPVEYFNLLLSEGAQAQMRDMDALQQFAR